MGVLVGAGVCVGGMGVGVSAGGGSGVGVSAAGVLVGTAVLVGAGVCVGAGVLVGMGVGRTGVLVGAGVCVGGAVAVGGGSVGTGVGATALDATSGVGARSTVTPVTPQAAVIIARIAAAHMCNLLTASHTPYRICACGWVRF